MLTNPPFGRSSSDSYERDDFWATTRNKQLNFVQHVVSLLRVGGTAAVVVPDNVLFEAGAKVSLDIFWLRDDSLTDTDDLPPPAALAAEIAEDLQAALEEIQTLAESLAGVARSDGAEAGN